MTAVEILEIVSQVLMALTALCYSYQLIYVILSLFYKETSSETPSGRRYAILIAARNEEAVIGHLLDSIRGQDYPAQNVTVFVVADNCTDGTARVAAAHGAQVITRSDTVHIGKGYALDYLLSSLKRSGRISEFDAFLVFDADNLLEPDYITGMDRLVSQGYDAFCGYRNAKNFGSNWLTAGYSLMYLHESAQLNSARMMLGTSCAVNGTGFGFTRLLLEKSGGWKFFTLTEDIEFSVWCATQGIRIGYCGNAVLYDEHPTQLRQSWRQRTRWVQGGIQVSVRCARDYWRGILRGGRAGWASFDMATRSLWCYALAIGTCCCTALLSFLRGGLSALLSAAALSLAGATLSMAALGLLIVATQWRRIRASRRQKLLSVLAYPLFMLSFLPIAFLAPFQKFQWKPIHHRVAISAETLLGKEP